MKHALIILGLTLVLPYPGAHSVANAQAESWQVACDDNRCQLFSAIRNDQGATLARLYMQNLAQDAQNSNVVALVSLPLGVYIPSGVAVDVDDDFVFRAQLLECREDEGCRAAFDLTPEILEEMKMGGKMSVAIVDGRSRRTISFNFSLMGFTKAYREFAARM
jgi:invasion protein IalB